MRARSHRRPRASGCRGSGRPTRGPRPGTRGRRRRGSARARRARTARTPPGATSAASRRRGSGCPARCAGRCRRAPCAVSTSRLPAQGRRRGSRRSGGSPRGPRSGSSSPRVRRPATTAMSAPVWREEGSKRLRAASHRPAAPIANPPAAATEPASIRPSRPAAAATGKSRASGTSLRPATIRAQTRLAASAESAARSWRPRNDEYRQPDVDTAKMSLPRSWRSATPVATALHETTPNEDEREVAAPPDDQGNRDHEERVLDELHVADEMVAEAIVGDGCRTQRRESEPRNEEGRRDPEDPSGRQGARAQAHGRGESSDGDREQRPVREPSPRPTSTRTRGRARAESARGGRGTEARERGRQPRASRDRRGCEGSTANGCSRPRSPPRRHYRRGLLPPAEWVSASADTHSRESLKPAASRPGRCSTRRTAASQPARTSSPALLTLTRMSSRVFRRRSATAAWIYAAVALRHRRDDRRGTRARPRRLRRVRDGARGRRLLPDPARPHRRGVAHEVRIPLRRRPGLGEVAAALPAGAAAQGRRRSTGHDLRRRARAVLGRALRLGRGRAGTARGSSAPVRPVVGERRVDGAPPPQPVRPSRRVPGRFGRACGCSRS